ncbi:hypothetical protein GGG16DRAFT_58528, partial [Schizophyllum commune]
MDTEISDIEDNAEHTVDDVLDNTARLRPRVALRDGHVQAESHELYVRHPRDRHVPVPTGAALPRRDREYSKLRYYRLMLILFKPWRTSHDLRDEGQTWEDAFSEFLESCDTTYKEKMENMQILHECRDSKDDYFLERRS